MAETDPGKKMDHILKSPERKIDDDDIFAGIPRAKTPPKSTPPKAEEKVEEKPPFKTKTDSDKPTKPSEEKSTLPIMERTLRAFWTVASVLSILVNIVLVAVLIVLYQNYTILKIPQGIDVDTPKNLLKGLYDNFELMEHASIETKIPVTGNIPVEFPLNIKQETTVILNEAVTIEGARVALTTGGLNIINAPATVTLPEGTRLPIILDMQVDVAQDVPIKDKDGTTLLVPVNIPLKETSLNEPFTNLQEVVRPLYCLVDKDAKSMIDGSAICP